MFLGFYTRFNCSISSNTPATDCPSKVPVGISPSHPGRVQFSPLRDQRDPSLRAKTHGPRTTCQGTLINRHIKLYLAYKVQKKSRYKIQK